MPKGEVLIEYRRPFIAIRQDPEWGRKIALGALISLIPYVGLVWMMGWQIQYQREVAWGRDERLPSWSHFSQQALLGLKAFAAVLPYSMVVSVVITPLMLAATTFIILASDVSSAHFIAGLIAVQGFTMIVIAATSVLLMPPTASTTVRVALYQTLESGLEIKEIWRLMREYRRELKRAWGFSALNSLIIFAVTTTYFAGFTLVFLFIVKAGSDWTLVLMLPIIGMALYPVFQAFSLYMGLASSHYFARYGRVAYELERLAIDLSEPQELA